MNLPIAERELRVAARSPRVYRGRMVACLIFGGMTGWMLWVTQGLMNTRDAAMAYGFVTSIALMFCMFAANSTADAISSEKRAGTLGFLFLTDLKGVDVIFGKLAAGGLQSVYGLMAIIPVMAMPVLVGGITGQSVFRTAIVLVNALFFSLSLGLWISTKSWEQKRALGSTAWIVILFLWGFPGLAALAEFRFGWTELAAVFKVLSPAYQMQHAIPFGVGMIRDYFWPSLAVTHALGWIWLWRACRIVPNAWQDKPEPALGKFKRRWNEFKHGNSDERAGLRRRLLEISAIHWLTSRDRFAIASTWIFLGVVLVAWIGIWIWANAVSNNGAPFWGIGIPMVMAMQLGLRLRTCAVASEVLTRDRFSGALELLLSTSMRIEEVTRGIWLTVLRVMIKPNVATYLIGAALFYFVLANRANGDELDKLWTIYICLNIWCVIDFFACVWTGMWMACVAKQQNAPAGLCIIRLIALPLLLFVGVLSFMGYFEQRWFFDSFWLVFLTWFAIMTGNSVFWIRRSRRLFYERIRTVAAERYQPPTSTRRWWKFWEWGRNAEPPGTVVIGQQAG